MPISYLPTLEHLSILAHFSGINTFPGLPELPAISRERCAELLPTLSEQGMIHLHREQAAVDLTLRFVLQAMAAPALVVKTQGGALGYCTRELGVAVSADARAPSKYRITPLPNAKELAAKLWKDLPGMQPADFSLLRKGGGWEDARLTKTELEAQIAQIYTEAIS